MYLEFFSVKRHFINTLLSKSTLLQDSCDGFTKEKRLGVALLRVGIFTDIVTHIEKDKYPRSSVYPWGVRGNVIVPELLPELEIWEFILSPLYVTRR